MENVVEFQIKENVSNIISAQDNDWLERRVHDLTTEFCANELENILAYIGVSTADMDLSNTPPLTAALKFRDNALAKLRSHQDRKACLNSAIAHITGSPACVRPLQSFFDRAIFVFGLRRGGNHAISTWLRGHFPESQTLYINSAEISQFEINGNILSIDKDKYTTITLEPHYKTLIVGYENIDPATFPFKHNAQIATHSNSVIILRDLANISASIAKQAQKEPAFAYRYRIKDLLNLWTVYCNYFINNSLNAIYIRFDYWFSDSSYRETLSDSLGLPSSDAGLNQVSKHGNGSSFDGTMMDGSAQQMDIINRWKIMLNNPLFIFLLLAHEDALELNKKLFNNFPFSREQMLLKWHNCQTVS